MSIDSAHSRMFVAFQGGVIQEFLIPQDAGKYSDAVAHVLGGAGPKGEGRPDDYFGTLQNTGSSSSALMESVEGVEMPMDWGHSKPEAPMVPSRQIVSTAGREINNMRFASFGGHSVLILACGSLQVEANQDEDGANGEAGQAIFLFVDQETEELTCTGASNNNESVPSNSEQTKSFASIMDEIELMDLRDLAEDSSLAERNLSPNRVVEVAMALDKLPMTAWGIAFNEESRVAAISTNAWEVSLYHIDLGDQSTESDTHRTSVVQHYLNELFPFDSEKIFPNHLSCDWRVQICPKRLVGHKHNIPCISFSTENVGRFASGSIDCSVRIWNFDAGTPDAPVTFRRPDDTRNWMWSLFWVRQQDIQSVHSDDSLWIVYEDTLPTQSRGARRNQDNSFLDWIAEVAGNAAATPTLTAVNEDQNDGSPRFRVSVRDSLRLAPSCVDDDFLVAQFGCRRNTFHVTLPCDTKSVHHQYDYDPANAWYERALANGHETMNSSRSEANPSSPADFSSKVVDEEEWKNQLFPDCIESDSELSDDVNDGDDDNDTNTRSGAIGRDVVEPCYLDLSKVKPKTSMSVVRDPPPCSVAAGPSKDSLPSSDSLAFRRKDSCSELLLAAQELGLALVDPTNGNELATLEHIIPVSCEVHSLLNIGHPMNRISNMLFLRDLSLIVASLQGMGSISFIRLVRKTGNTMVEQPTYHFILEHFIAPPASRVSTDTCIAGMDALQHSTSGFKSGSHYTLFILRISGHVDCLDISRTPGSARLDVRSRLI